MENESTAQEKLNVLFEKTFDYLTLSAKLSEDKQKLFLDCVPIKGEGGVHLFTKEELAGILAEQVQSDTLEMNLLDGVAKLLNEGKEVLRRRVAKGTAAVDGKDGKLVFLAKKYQPEVVEAIGDRTDLRSRHLFDNVEKGTEIARVFSPTKGTDGRDVFGKPISAKAGTPCKFSLDKSINLAAKEQGKDYEALVANMRGYLAEESGKLQIRDTLIIPGDVAFTTGNIDFVGHLVVSGNVEKDFVVTALGNIKVDGDVHGGYLRSGGRVDVGGSVIGPLILEVTSEEGKQAATKLSVSAAQGLKAFRLQNAAVEISGDIEVVKEVLNAVVRAKQALLMPQGQVLASTVYLTQGGEFFICGSQMGSRTVINLVTDVESGTEYRNLIESLDGHDEAIDLVKLQIGPFVENPKKLEALKEPQRGKIRVLIQKYAELHQSKAALLKKKEEVLAAAKANLVLRFNVLDKLYAGTEMCAKDDTFNVPGDLQGPLTVEYLPDGNKFQFGELKPLREKEEKKAAEKGKKGAAEKGAAK